MKAWAVVEHREPLQKIEIESRPPVGTEVVLSVSHCGVCHSDLHFWDGEYNLGAGRKMKLSERGVTLPRAIGHEVVGTVIAVGPQAEGVEVGDRRIVYPWIGCGTCEACQAEEDNLCERQSSIGVVRHGGFGEEVTVPHPRYLVDLGGIDPALAATFACSGITVYSAIAKLGPLAPDKPVALVGAGGLGLQAIQMLKALGHDAIVSIDVNPEKRRAAVASGASAAIDGADPELTARVIEAAGGRLAGAIDFVNSERTAAPMLDALAKGGRLVLVGVAGGELPLSLSTLIFRPRSIIGSNTGNLADLRAVVELARQGRLKPLPLTLMPKDSVNQALSLLHDGKVTGRIVLTAEPLP